MPVPVTASAPGKVILLGEHAVVYGEPAIAVAVDRRTRVTVRDAADAISRVNGYPLSAHFHVHLRLAVDRLAPDAPVDLTTVSSVPSAAGLGSSAALTTACVRALLERAGASKGEEHLAREAYEIEWLAQGGRGSPTDTSTVTHGRAVLVQSEPGDGLLWTVERGERRWHLHHLDPPPLRLVIGNTGERGRTADQVAKVARFVKRTGFAREVIRDLGEVTRDGLDAVRSGDGERLGAAMDRAHNALTTLGCTTPRLERAVNAARRAGALGAKLTGSGGGGSMIALVETDADAARVASALARAGATPYTTALGADGARVEAGDDA